MHRVHRLMIVWIVVIVSISIGYGTAQAGWVRLGDDTYVGIREQICKDGFVVAMAYTDDNLPQPSTPPDLIPKHIFAIPLLNGEQYNTFGPRQPIAEGTIELTYHNQPITGLPDQTSDGGVVTAHWYGATTIRWNSQPDFVTYPQIAIIWTDTPVSNTDPLNGVHGLIGDPGLLPGDPPVPLTIADMQDCYVFGSPTWNFGASGSWSKTNDLSSPAILPTGRLYNVKGGDPYIIGDSFKSYDSSFNYSYVAVTMSTTTENCAQIFFQRTGDSDFDQSRMVQFTPDVNGLTRTYWVNMAVNSQWKPNDLSQLRLDPACSAGSPSNENIVTINSIRLANSPFIWDFGLDQQGNPPGDQGWKQLSDLSEPDQQPTGLHYTVTGNDPIIENNSLVSGLNAIDGTSFPYVGITMATDTDTCAQFFFHHPSEADYSEQASLKFPVIPDGQTHTYLLNLGGHPDWNDPDEEITNLRLDPACSSGGGDNIRLDNIFIMQKDYFSWDFGGEAQGWDVTQDLYEATQTGTGLHYVLSGSDPFIVGPTLFQPTPMENIPQIAVTMASTVSNCAQFFFWRNGETNFSEPSSYFFQPVADGVSHTYHIAAASNLNWNGTLYKLRLDPACSFGGTNQVQMDSIVLSQTNWDFAHGPQGWTQDDGDINSSYREPLFPTQEYHPDWPVLADRFRRAIYSPAINLQSSDYSTAAVTLQTSTETCGQLYFKRDIDVGFDSSRMVQFALNPDGAPHTYQVNLAANPSWSNNIVQLLLKPFCSTTGAYVVDLLNFSLLPPSAPADPPNAAPLRNYFTIHTPTLTWNHVPNADSYEIEIADNAAFTGANPIPVSGVSYTVNLSNGTYFWRVRAVKSGLAGMWSVSDSFTIEAS